MKVHDHVSYSERGTGVRVTGEEGRDRWEA
jgi:hypothetical protein